MYFLPICFALIYINYINYYSGFNKMETVHSESSIKVPPNLLLVLKQFAVSAIRQQPEDLLKWSVTYFAKCCEQHPEIPACLT